MFKDNRVRSQENHKTAVAFKFVKKDKKKVYEGAPAMQKNLSGATLTDSPPRPPPTYDMSRNGSMIFESPVDEKSSYMMYPMHKENSPGPSTVRLVDRFDSDNRMSTKSTAGGDSQFREIDMRASRFVGRDDERMDTSGSLQSINGLLADGQPSSNPNAPTPEDPKPTMSNFFGREARLSMFLTLTLLVLDTIVSTRPHVFSLSCAQF